jgi:hypothetical protein
MVGMMRLLDLFSGRWGWSRAFAARGWECWGIDLTTPPEFPAHCNFLKMDILDITPQWIAEHHFDFICASSPCEQFSVHGMKHFHPNPPYPELGIKLFNHTRALCEASGVPYVMENVRAAQKFVGKANAHAGPFYLWWNIRPMFGRPLPRGITKGIDVGSSKIIKTMNKEQRRVYRSQFIWNQAWSSSLQRGRDTAKAATIPPELSACVCDYAERILEQHHAA